MYRFLCRRQLANLRGPRRYLAEDTYHTALFVISSRVSFRDTIIRPCARQHSIRREMASAPVDPSNKPQVSLELPVVGIEPVRKVKIELTALEASIFEVLLAAVQTRGLNCTVRVAGGWVRDKLMGRTSHDIDVALDNVTGVEYANAVNAHLTALGEKTSSVGVIQANPDQSKHLETATARVLGLWVDFVQLRAESYDPNSRIPLVAAGTPKQDAERRDFTINSLLYNLTEGCIEDWTGQGLSDLEAGILRTPLPAETTFRDDPLRLLRAVRFASRFGFRMEPSLRAAASSPSIHADLASKVSRERYGIEIDGMLGGTGRPVAAMRALHSLGLTGLVLAPPYAKLTGRFTLPVAGAEAGSCLASFPADAVAASTGGQPVLPPSWTHVGMASVEATAYLCALATQVPHVAGWLTDPAATVCTEWAGEDMTPLLAAVQPCPGLGFHAPTQPWAEAPECSPDELPTSGLSADDRRLLVLAAQLSPLSLLSRINAKNREEPLVPVVLTESIKRKVKDGTDVQCILNGAAAFTACMAAEKGGLDRLAVGTVLRGVAKEHWRLSLLLAASHRVLPVLIDSSCSQQVHPTTPTGVAAQSAHRVIAALQPVAALRAAIDAWGLDGCWAWKPVLTGSEVTSSLGLPPGPATGVLMAELAKWQIVHGGGTRADAMEDAGAGAGDLKATALAHLQAIVEAAGGAGAFTAKHAIYHGKPPAGSSS